MRKTFHVLVLHVGVLFHLLGPVDGGFVIDGLTVSTESRYFM